MAQRIVTGLVSAALFFVVLFLRGWFLDVVIALAALLGCYEMMTAFQKAGLKPACWPVYGMAGLMLPVYWLLDSVGVYLLGVSATMLIMLQMALRKQPQWADAAASLNALISINIPLTMLYPIIRIQPEMLGLLLFFSVFVIALVGDTFAYFIGVALGKHKMAPALSPKKTWEGAAGGLLGSVVSAMLLCTSGGALTPMPPVWHFALLGLIGGIAGQLGDLSASLIKRFCGIKDFGSLFPGQGGMMDRIDSVIFVTYVVFGYCMATGLFAG